jgi:DNA replication and repair protein RecF
MYLRDLKLDNFRNFKEFSNSFPPGVNLIYGENGAGKTNLLEAIHYLTIARSHRGRRDDELIRFDSDFFRISAAAVKGQSTSRFEVTYSKERTPHKKVLIDGSSVERLSSVVGRFRGVILSFDDLSLVSGPPYWRRRFLDILLSAVSSSYLADLIAYKRVLLQRNKQLWEMKVNSKKNMHLLESWDSQLVELGARIASKRNEVSTNLAEIVDRLCPSMGIHSEVNLSYLPSFPLENPVEDSFRERLTRESNRELQRGQTLIGPHRDDMRILFDGRDLRRFGSCGQQRLVAVAMKFAEATLLNELYSDSPVLMLDEVLVELDLPTRERVLDQLKTYSQIFVASASRLELEGPHVTHYTLRNESLKWKE